MESGEDENEIHSARMDGWIAWEHRGVSKAVDLMRSFYFPLSFVLTIQVVRQPPISLLFTCTSESC